MTVIGEPDSNRKAMQMILEKILEDPQSGSCLNISYSDVHGLVANFNPTGSPYAQANGGASGGPSGEQNSNVNGAANNHRLVFWGLTTTLTYYFLLKQKCLLLAISLFYILLIFRSDV